MTIHYISGNSELESCISRIAEADEIAVDLEFDKNRYRYGFNLCLVQICHGSTCYLIDPLSDDLDIETLFPVLEDPEVQKVVFAFGEDLRLLHTLGCFPRNIYDLNIATSLLSYKTTSLASYIAEILGRDTGKSSQQSNWYKRPLTEDQKGYAAQDVLHLVDLKEILAEEAAEKGLTGWINEENSILDELNFAGMDSKTYIKDKYKKGLTEQEWYLLKELLEFREEIAKSYNKPSYQVIHRDFLIELAKDPAKLEEWENTRGIFRAIKNRKYRDQIARLLREAAEEAEKQGLSKTDPAVRRLDKEEYQAMKEERTRVNRIKSNFFAPIKSRITEDYGREAATFMLSNRIVSEVIRGEQELETYKREPIEKYAREMNLDTDILGELVTD